MQLSPMTLSADRLDLAVVTFDLSSSGVNRNALRIAAAAQAAGMAVEIWSAQDYGELSDELPSALASRLVARLAAAPHAAVGNHRLGHATLSELITPRRLMYPVIGQSRPSFASTH